MDRWVLETYRTVIDTRQSNAWMLLLFFIFALIVFVILMGLKLRMQPATVKESTKGRK